jgi:hypothetical protein
MSAPTREVEERRSLNGMWHKGKGKLTVLRLACGLDSRGHGAVSRDHIYVPDTPGNAMLSCAETLVEDGMMRRDFEKIERVIGTEGSICFSVTEKGVAYAKGRVYSNGKNGALLEDPFNRANSACDLNHAMESVVESRREIVEQIGSAVRLRDGQKGHYYREIEDELCEAITSLGRASYMLGHPPKGIL